MMNLFSIGFTQKSAEDFFALLKDNKISQLPASFKNLHSISRLELGKKII